ncbi:MAG TPA: hypothetical protein PLY81_05555 [Chitinophagaceae bacterium]|nr:hypothetical protein [Chitinophagaceae bacterium]MCC6635465.1 hypothetical protein [Chitinophagaceae bacterium]HNE92781.1 hypothetical protein [Chitinophagaceae bacterium]HNF29726.1 hypothetical protein [Chitinophagaceae bacterium]HNJ57431.1 hypothetical protein [Chitinophagaceae bacterium]
MHTAIKKYIITFIFATVIAHSLFAQSCKINYVITDTINNKTLQSFKLLQQFNDSIACINYINQLPNNLQAKGYISASVDSIFIYKNNYTVTIFVGKKFNWKLLKISDTDLISLQLAGIDHTIFSAKPFNPKQVELVQNNLLEYFVNNGYPFASIGFSNLIIEENDITATLRINKGIFYSMDSISIIGNAKISKQFLYKYLNLPKKSLFSLKKLQSIDKKIAELNFINSYHPSQITMLGASYYTNLFLNNKKSNQVDAIIGLLPNNTQNNGSLLLTVDAKLKLENAFAKGETIGVLWQQLQPKTPRLNLLFQYPYIFNSAFIADFNFNLFKKDTSFINIQSSIGFIYKPNYKQHIKFALQINQSNLLDIDTTTLKLTKQLPDIIDVTINNIAIEYGYNSTDYKFNPRRGTEILLLSALGNKKIKKNNSISQLKDGNFNFSNLYNNLKLNSYQIKIQTEASHYFSLSKYKILKTKINAGVIYSPTVYRNEMYQIGGLKLLRGFDEESIFTDKYLVATTEYRYLFDVNAFFNCFIDYALSNNSIFNKSYQYLGLGGGLSFETKQGIFNIAIATGKRNDETINLKRTKIHIGFVSIF